MSSDHSWIDSYFARIGYTGGRDVSYETLNGIHTSHLLSVPFENLDILLGRHLSLNLDDVVKKIVFNRRGGICTEQNALLYGALTVLGFSVTRLLGRFQLLAAPGSEVAKIHAFLKADLDNKQYLVDVGSGSFSPISPIEIGYEGEVTSPYSPPRRLIQGEKNTYRYQTNLQGQWLDVYTFNLEAIPHIDWEVANWYTSTYPTAKYVNMLALELMTKDKVFSFKDNYLRTRLYDGTATLRKVNTPEELLEVLSQSFGLDFPADTKFGKPGKYWPKDSEMELRVPVS